MIGEGRLGFASDSSVPALETSEFEPIHAGARHKLYRRRGSGEAVVLKVTAAKLPGAAAIASMRHEYELLRDLDVPGVVKVLGLVATDQGLALTMMDAGSSNVAELSRRGPLPIAQFFAIAVQVTNALTRLHDAHIVHRDVSPANIVWDAVNARATLTDFGIATTLSALTVESFNSSHLEATLAYVAPEQTGRTGRSADSRADLYSLGATFYEMLTGRPPFVSDDPIAIIHAHLARQPKPAHELNEKIPRTLSDIVAKLLEKEPERRYQTAEALGIDLAEASSQCSRTGTVVPFLLAHHDVPRELNIPDKLYGRDREIAALTAAFARASQGGREMVVVTGEPGIGKSALVNYLARPVTEHHGLYVTGKFDQLQRSLPFSGLAQAFRALLRSILTEPERLLRQWRERIAAAVAPNGAVLVEVIPELERLLGPQLPVPEVGPVESQNRLHLTFNLFLRVFARENRPLTLFLDDLQWADAASLQLIDQWIRDTDSRYLLLIGAYRDHEVGSSHPLTRAIAAWRAAGTALPEIHLGPIGQEDVAQLAADAFNEDIHAVRPLASTVMRKTAGNPFFVRRLLRLMQAEGLIRFEPMARLWRWDDAELARAPMTDNVVDLMTRSIERLPPATQKLLQVGACIGHRFDFGTLADVSGNSRTTATDQLWPALQDGLLIPLRDAYKASRRDGPMEAALDALPGVVQFAHDRVQQAAYNFLTTDERRALHLDIGRRLLDTANGHLDDRLFEVVDQLDLGETLVVDPPEHQRLVELNLAAGRKARASAAYQAAFEYLSVALRHLPPSAWQGDASLTFALHRELAECAYLTGQHTKAEELIEIALEHAPSKVAKGELYSLRVLAATVAGDWAQALRWGRDGLAVFGLEWPRNGLQAAIEAETAAVMTNLRGRRIEDLVAEPETEDEDVRESMRLLSILGPPAYFSGDEVLTYIVTRATNLSLQRGPSPYSAYAYVFYGGLHNVRTSEHDVGYAFGKLALALARRFGNRAEESRTLEVFGLVVHIWKAPFRDSLPLLREGYRAGVESGELAYAAFNLDALLINGFPAGVPLPDILTDADAVVHFASKHKNRTALEIALPFRQLARALMGNTRSPESFDDPELEEASFLDQAQGNQTAVGFYWVCKLESAYLIGDYATAQRCSDEAAKRIQTGILGMASAAEHVFYTALTLAAQCQPSRRNAFASGLRDLESLHQTLTAWANHSPANFAHKAALIGAEIARIRGARAEALDLYRAAIDGAARQACTQDAAMAHELRAGFWLSWQEPAFAGLDIRAAFELYQRWGASAKAQRLEREHPEYFRKEVESTTPRFSIDGLALMRASQAISAETLTQRLFEHILRVAAEVAGAQKGALVLCDDEQLRVCARIETAAALSVSFSDEVLENCSDLPAAILRYVARMKEPLILANAAATGAFTNDPAVTQRTLRSVLCAPLVKQTQIVGLLYLENAAMASAFSTELIQVVQILASQAVISLENARLHEASKLEIEQRKQAEAALSEADQRKDEFLAMLAHELRNPLAPIRTASEVLTKMFPADSRVLSVVSMIKRQATQLTRLVDDLLDVSRITQGRIQLNRAPVDLAEVIAGAVEAVEPLLRSQQHRVSIAAGLEPVWVDGDFARLVQCICNLLNNAAKYTGPGGEIRIQTAIEGTWVSVQIIDNGVGISRQLLPRVFDLFVQSDRAIDRSQGGLGIGLSVVKRLVQMHGGEVSARSDGEGQGTTFEIRLPRIERRDATAADATPTAAPDQRVLVVDDNVDAASSLALLLELQGQTTEVAYDGKQALERVPAFRPDLVLLDLGLPEMDGYEVARRIRATPEFREIRLVALSGYGQPEDLRRTQAAGFDGHLVKPVDMAMLMQVLIGRPNDRTPPD